MGRRFDLQSRLLGSIPSLSTGQKNRSGKGADGSTPALGAGGSRFDSEVPDWNADEKRGDRSNDGITNDKQ